MKNKFVNNTPFVWYFHLYVEIACVRFQNIYSKEKLLLTFIMHLGIHLMNALLPQYVMQM